MHLTSEEHEIVDEILRFYLPKYEVWAFGSRVSGNLLKKFSDLDLVVITQERMPVKTWARVKDAFELSDLPFRVDVLDWSALTPNFRDIIRQQYEILQKPQSQGN